MKTLHCVIKGRVQGVFFRAWTRDRARALGLAGWVRNLAGGHVEVLAQGPDQSLEKFQKLLHEGPRLSRVDRVECEPVDGQEPMTGFAITG